MNKKIATIILIYLLTFTLEAIKSEIPNRTFTAKDNVGLNRQSGTIVSPDGNYVVFGARKWNSETGKNTNNLYYAPISTPDQIKNLTLPSYDYSDMSPSFSSKHHDVVFFLRSQEGRVHLYYLPFPPESPETQPTKLTDYVLDIGNYAIQGDTLVFSTDMFYECGSNMTCTASKNKEIEDRGANTYQIYTELMARHWDTWYTEGKASQVFYQKMQGTGTDISLIGEPVDIIAKLNFQAPPIENGAEQFAVSPNENLIAFSYLERNKNMPKNTVWEIKYYDISTGTLHNVTEATRPEGINGRCQCPLFSNDGNYLSMMCMKRAGLESDQYHIEIYDMQAGVFITPGFVENFKPALNSYSWIANTETSKTFLLSVVEEGCVRIYTYDFMATADPFKSLTNDHNAYGQPIIVSDNLMIVSYSNFVSPEKVGKLEYNAVTDTWVLTDIADLNKDTMKQFNLKDGESFNFTGSFEDIVQGWILKPVNYEEGKKYPVALLIHGGPEGAWEPAWSYRWNPQLWVNHGFAVVMINPHGSSGMGIDFQDKVRYNWGGAPFDDIMMGLEYAIANYDFLDGDRVGACGGSYGGFMANWIQGHNDEDKIKCLVTHDGVFSTTTMFYSTEELWFPMAEYCPLDHIGCTPFENGEEYREGFTKYSPEQYIDHWHTPHLIIHGDLDFRIPLTEGISVFTALQMKGVPSRYVHFPHENHWVLKPENSIKWYDEVLGWLDKYLHN